VLHSNIYIYIEGERECSSDTPFQKKHRFVFQIDGCCKGISDWFINLYFLLYQNETFDATFNIECVDDSEEEQGPKCCSVVTVDATGDIYKYQVIMILFFGAFAKLVMEVFQMECLRINFHFCVCICEGQMLAVSGFDGNQNECS